MATSFDDPPGDGSPPPMQEASLSAILRKCVNGQNVHLHKLFTPTQQREIFAMIRRSNGHMPKLAWELREFLNPLAPFLAVHGNDVDAVLSMILISAVCSYALILRDEARRNPHLFNTNAHRQTRPPSLN